MKNQAAINCHVILGDLATPAGVVECARSANTTLANAVAGKKFPSIMRISARLMTQKHV